MEDCVDKNESLASLSNLKPDENSSVEEKKSLSNGDDHGPAVSTGEEESAVRNGENGGAGFIETMANKLGFVSSSEVSAGEEEMGVRSGEKKNKDHEEENNNGAGFIETVANKLGFVSSSGEEMLESNGQKKEEEEENNGRGIIESAANKLGFGTHNSSSNQENGGEKNEGHGIIDHIKSKLPESLPVSEDQATTADEASLLISIIED